jgi:hypothetical protein
LDKRLAAAKVDLKALLKAFHLVVMMVHLMAYQMAELWGSRRAWRMDDSKAVWKDVERVAPSAVEMAAR